MPVVNRAQTYRGAATVRYLKPKAVGSPLLRAIPFDHGHPLPAELSLSEISRLVEAFSAAAQRAAKAGFEQIRRETGLLTGAVGLITDPAQAEAIITNGHADLVLLAREFLREPYWPIKASQELNGDLSAPVQYGRAFAKPSNK